jgi:hypothetical protein
MPNRSKRKYFGTIELLQVAIAGTGAVGFWAVCDEPRLHTFRSSAGEIVNWWPRTGTLQFQGLVSSAFVQGVISALGGSVRQIKQSGEQLSMLQ